MHCEHPEDVPAVSDARRLALREQACDLLHILQIADGDFPAFSAGVWGGVDAKVPIPEQC